MNLYRILLVLILLSLNSCNRLPQPGANSAVTAKSRAAAARKANALPDTRPLTAADVDLYVDIMKAAVAKIENADPDSRKAMEFLRRMNSSGSRGILNEKQRALLTRGTELASTDTAIARQRGVEDRYLAIKARMESLVQPCPACDENDPVRKSDLALVTPRIDEVEPLQVAMHDALMPAQ